MIIGISGKIGAGKNTVASIIQYLIWADSMKGSSDIPVFKDWKDWINPEDSGWSQKSFASKLKQIASILTGVPIEKWEDQTFKDSFMREEWIKIILSWKHGDDGPGSISFANVKDVKDYVDNNFEDSWEDVVAQGQITYQHMTYRQFLQELGTNAIRDKIHPNTWVNALFADYKLIPDPAFGVGEMRTSNGDMRAIFTREEAFREMYPANHIYPNWLITDVRFPNEAQAIKYNRGININLLRNTVGWPQTCMTCFQGFTFDEIGKDRYAPCRHGLNYASVLAEPQHISETALDDYKFDCTIDNRFCTLEELVEKVRAMLIYFKIIKDNES